VEKKKVFFKCTICKCAGRKQGVENKSSSQESLYQAFKFSGLLSLNKNWPKTKHLPHTVFK
jgi:hypothetical protein